MIDLNPQVIVLCLFLFLLGSSLGYMTGKRTMLLIMESHLKQSRDIKAAIEYERAVIDSEIPQV